MAPAKELLIGTMERILKSFKKAIRCGMWRKMLVVPSQLSKIWCIESELLKRGNHIINHEIHQRVDKNLQLICLENRNGSKQVSMFVTELQVIG